MVKFAVRKQICPCLQGMLGQASWTVTDRSGRIVMCSQSWKQSYRHAHERACATEQPGTGDQVHQHSE